MSEITPFVILFSSTTMILFLGLGLIVGWIGNDIVYALSNNNNPSYHPEMYDENGNLLPDELIAVRFENFDEYEDDEE
jgi:hypothetical protein